MSNHRPVRVVEFIVHYVYLGTMFLNGGLFLFLPRQSAMTYAEYKTVFLGFLGVTFVTFPLVFLIYRNWASPKAVAHLHKVVGSGKASASFKIACIILTCIGDFSGIAGASLFTFTRDPYSLPLFLGTWAAQYAFSSYVVRRGRTMLEELDNAEMPARATA